MRHTEAAQQAILPCRPLCRWRVLGEPHGFSYAFKSAMTLSTLCDRDQVCADL